MIKEICVSYLLGPSYIDLTTIRYVTQINLGIKVAVLFYSPRSFHTKEDFFNENNVPQVLLFLPEQSPSHDHQHFYIHLLSRQSVQQMCYCFVHFCLILPV